MSAGTILAIDPGPEESAWLLYDTESKQIANFAIQRNVEFAHEFFEGLWKRNEHFVDFDLLAIEMVASYGKPVGKSIFETCVWIGRLIEICQRPWAYVYRREVRLYLSNSMWAKSGEVRQALIDKFPATGGGKVPQIGLKAKPGPLYGIHDDVWSALGVAVTFAEQPKEN